MAQPICQFSVYTSRLEDIMTYKEVREKFTQENKKTYSILDLYREKVDFMYFCKNLLAKGEITNEEYLRFTN